MKPSPNFNINNLHLKKMKSLCLYLLAKVSPTTKTIKKLTPTELEERRDKGLCFNCDEKIAPGHQYKKLFFIEVGWLDKHGEGSLEDEG